MHFSTGLILAHGLTGTGCNQYQQFNLYKSLLCDKTPTAIDKERESYYVLHLVLITVLLINNCLPSRPDLLDAALLRPGRFDRLLFCDFPQWRDRLDILSVLSKKVLCSLMAIYMTFSEACAWHFYIEKKNCVVRNVVLSLSVLCLP